MEKDFDAWNKQKRNLHALEKEKLFHEREIWWLLPLTRSDKRKRYYIPITVGDTNSVVILSQLRLISSKRLQRYMHKLPKGQFSTIVQRVQEFFPKMNI